MSRIIFRYLLLRLKNGTYNNLPDQFWTRNHILLLVDLRNPSLREDWDFVSQLTKEYGCGSKIDPAGYYMCHFLTAGVDI